MQSARHEATTPATHQTKTPPNVRAPVPQDPPKQERPPASESLFAFLHRAVHTLHQERDNGEKAQVLQQTQEAVADHRRVHMLCDHAGVQCHKAQGIFPHAPKPPAEKVLNERDQKPLLQKQRRLSAGLQDPGESNQPVRNHVLTKHQPYSYRQHIPPRLSAQEIRS